MGGWGWVGECDGGCDGGGGVSGCDGGWGGEVCMCVLNRSDQL